MKPTKNYKIDEICYVTDYVANGSFASLKENVEYLKNDGYAILVRLTDFTKQWQGPFVYISKAAYDFLKKSSLQKGDLIMSNVGETGKVFILPELNKPASLGPNSILIRPNETIIDKEYLYYYFISNTGQLQIKKISSATTQSKFNKTAFRAITLTLPELSEQKQIVSKIKECFTLLDKSEAKLKQAEKKLQVTILSARLKAFISDNTTYKQIGELAEVITKGSTPTSYGYPYIESGINFIKVESIEDQMINQARINCFISEEANNFLSRSKLREDDILFSIAGTIGKVAIVEKNILPANTNQALAIIRGYKKYFKPKYLYYFLQSAAIEELKQKARGGAMNNISLNDIKSFNIPITDFKTQERVIQYLEKTESVIKKSLKSIFIKSDQIQTLRQSILKKAFEGKLI